MARINHLKIDGKRYVLLPEYDYERLKDAEALLPPLPQPDSRGYTPAIEFTRASIARDIILIARPWV